MRDVHSGDENQTVVLLSLIHIFKQISVEPVVAEDSEEYALREEDLPKLFAEYDKLAAEMVERKKSGKDFNFFHFMIDLEGGPCVAKRLSGCGSGTEYLAVTPWGDFYPCHQFVGNEEFLICPVSYTHLDVYKRQFMWISMRQPFPVTLW